MTGGVVPFLQRPGKQKKAKDLTRSAQRPEHRDRSESRKGLKVTDSAGLRLRYSIECGRHRPASIDWAGDERRNSTSCDQYNTKRVGGGNEALARQRRCWTLPFRLAGLWRLRAGPKRHRFAS